MENIIELFKRIPHSGKPKENSEFTVLAAIIGTIESIDIRQSKSIIVSLATGTKCAGKHREDSEGYILW
jgi:hypothetical protein